MTAKSARRSPHHAARATPCISAPNSVLLNFSAANSTARRHWQLRGGQHREPLGWRARSAATNIKSLPAPTNLLRPPHRACPQQRRGVSFRRLDRAVADTLRWTPESSWTTPSRQGRTAVHEGPMRPVLTLPARGARARARSEQRNGTPIEQRNGISGHETTDGQSPRET